MRMSPNQVFDEPLQRPLVERDHQQYEPEREWEEDCRAREWEQQQSLQYAAYTDFEQPSTSQHWSQAGPSSYYQADTRQPEPEPASIVQAYVPPASSWTSLHYDVPQVHPPQASPSALVPPPALAPEPAPVPAPEPTPTPTPPITHTISTFPRISCPPCPPRPVSPDQDAIPRLTRSSTSKSSEASSSTPRTPRTPSALSAPRLSLPSIHLVPPPRISRSARAPQPFRAFQPYPTRRAAISPGSSTFPANPTPIFGMFGSYPLSRGKGALPGPTCAPETSSWVMRLVLTPPMVRAAAANGPPVVPAPAARRPRMACFFCRKRKIACGPRPGAVSAAAAAPVAALASGSGKKVNGRSANPCSGLGSGRGHGCRMEQGSSAAVTDTASTNKSPAAALSGSVPEESGPCK
jgi:hypothetical protein